MKLLAVSAGMLALMTSTLCAAELKVPMNKVSASGVGDSIGTIIISEKPTGIEFKIDVNGFHRDRTGFMSTRQAIVRRALRKVSRRRLLPRAGITIPIIPSRTKGPKAPVIRATFPY